VAPTSQARCGLRMSARGHVAMSAREAEEVNRELAHGTTHTGQVFMFVPVQVLNGPLQKAATPKICVSKSGEFVEKASSAPRAGPGRSVPRFNAVGSSEVSRKRATTGDPSGSYTGAAASSKAQQDTGGPRCGLQRSKRPKLQPQTNRTSMGGDQADGVMKPCARLLRELMRNEQLARPFLRPVDPVLYPDYYEVVHDPLDFGTVKKRMDAGEYEDPDEFATEVRRVWNNAFLYNQQGTEVHRMASDLQRIFEDKFRELPTCASDFAATSEMKKMQKQMVDMRKQLEIQNKLMQQQQQLQAMQQQMTMGVQQSVAPRAGAAKSRAKPPPGQFPLVPMAPEQTALVAVDETRDMTFEEKAEMSTRINKLSSNNLSKVVQIIKSSMPSLGQGEDEIEVDINALDNRSLWKLHNFVKSCEATKKKAKKAPVTAASRMQAIQRATASTDHKVSQIEAGIKSIEASRGMHPGGISLQHADLGRGADSPSDSDSEAEGYSASAAAGSGVGTNALWAEFQNTKQQREQQQQQQAREQADRSRQAAANTQRERDAQRAAERASHEQDGGVDMLGQSNMMANWERNGVF